MTFFLDDTGKQYVVIAAGGHGRMGTTIGDYLVAYALPDQKYQGLSAFFRTSKKGSNRIF
jgi:hypothetical protein